MKSIKVFVDSDVIISSLISEKGAAYFLLDQQKANFIISSISKVELEEVVDRLQLDQTKLKSLMRKKLKVIKLTKDISSIEKNFKNYTSDLDDTHIVAGAIKAKAKFLLTYNLRHFDKQRISKDLSITVLTPAQYLQYLRSLG